MTLRQPKQIITSIFKKYAKRQDNVVYADKLFIINTVVNTLFKNRDSKNFNKDLVEYGEIINRFLNNEVDIFWEGDTIMVKELDPLDKQTSGE
jgi:hypothetical protein